MFGLRVARRGFVNMLRGLVFSVRFAGIARHVFFNPSGSSGSSGSYPPHPAKRAAKS